MNWIPLTLNSLPPFNTPIIVRYDCGGLQLTTFKGLEVTQKVVFKFNPQTYIFQDMQMRGKEPSEPTHFCIVESNEFEINIQPE